MMDLSIVVNGAIPMPKSNTSQRVIWADMVNALYEFEVPVLAAMYGGLAKCQLIDNRRLYISFTGTRMWGGMRHLGVDWKVVWEGDGLEMDLSEKEKALIDQHLQRAYRVRAFL
jgi:hypothetical protein